MCGRSCEEMPVKRARPLFLAQSRALTSSSIVGLGVLAALLQAGDPPQVDVLQAGLLQARRRSSP